MKYTFADLTSIIAKLRSEQGCPWDREQTHQSLIPCLLEETQEVIEGIHILEKEKDAENLCEELGDVLLQVMLHSQIAKEAGLFTIEDVVQGISEKMIRRHPHVFGDKNLNNTQEVLQTWEEIKSKEKELKSAKRIEKEKVL